MCIGVELAIGQARREDDVLARLAGHVPRQIFVGQEDDSLRAERLDDRGRVARRAADVALGLDIGIRIDVGDDRHAGEAGLERAHVIRRDAGGQGAARLERGQQDRARGIEDLGRLGHEPDAAEDDDVPVGRRGLPAQVQRVAHVIGDGVKQGRLHVVMAQDHGVARHLELVDFVGQLRFDAQLERRGVVAHACSEVPVDIVNRLPGAVGGLECRHVSLLWVAGSKVEC